MKFGVDDWLIALALVRSIKAINHPFINHFRSCSHMVLLSINISVCEQGTNFHTRGALLTVTAVHNGLGRHMLMLHPERIVPFVKVSLHYRLSLMFNRAIDLCQCCTCIFVLSDEKILKCGRS